MSVHDAGREDGIGGLKCNVQQTGVGNALHGQPAKKSAQGSRASQTGIAARRLGFLRFPRAAPKLGEMIEAHGFDGLHRQSFALKNLGLRDDVIL